MVASSLAAGTDSLPANVAMNAVEQQKVLSQPGPAHMFRGYIYAFCTHHQCNLASKPVLLALPGVATGGPSGMQRSQHSI